jgi:putative FmdB family regulatory protein
MPTYEFSCPSCSTFEASYSMAEVPDAMDCPDCGRPARRRMSAPRLSIASSSAYGLIDSAERSADAPSVVSSIPGARSGPVQRYTSNPLHRKLPKP